MEDEDPPPPPRLRAPPALPDELVEEILLRSPPDDPARLVRAALVCKRWARLVSARAFRCRFRDFHLQRRGVPMLGFLHNERGPNDAVSARFIRTSASCPPIDTQRGWIALDARGGRVLLHRVDKHTGHMLADGVFDASDPASRGIRLAVWDPLSAAAGGGHLELPVPILPGPILPWPQRSWNAALLCSDQHGLQDHADGHFRVVLVVMGPEGTFICVYSSLAPASWSEPSYAAQHLDHGILDAVRGALVGNALYFLFQRRTKILKYDLATGDMSVIRPPLASNGRMLCAVLTTTATEDGSLGFARVEGSKLWLWSREPRPNGGALAMWWTIGRLIELRGLYPVIDLLGFADGVGMFLVGTIDGFFSVDKKSGRIDKLGDGPGFFSVDQNSSWIDKLKDRTGLYSGIVPYVSFYTPAVGKASTDEGPSANA